MKLLLALSTLLAFGSAQASYFATHCSNSDASVTWETGHNTNTMTLKHLTNDDKDITLAFYDLTIDMTNKTVIDEVSVHRCGFYSSKQIYAGKVVITASEQNPSALDFLGENKKIETEVICKSERNGRSACPTEPIEMMK